MRTCCAKNLLLLAFISGGCFLPSSVAQVVVRRGPQKAKVPVSRLPADRKMEGWLRRASEAYARKDWALAVAFCQKILESGRTAYITREEAPKVLARLAQKETAKPPAVSLNINPSKAHPSTPSVPVPEDPGNLINLEQAARWLLFNMPEAGRELYRAQYSGLAEQKLAMARKENDVFALSRVWSMYPLTPSAWGAANRLGTHLLEQGKLLLAVKEFEKLIQHPEFSDLASPEMLLKLGFAQITLGRDAKDTMQLYASTFAGRLASAGGDKRSAAAFFEQTWELPDLPVSVARDWPSFLGSEKRNVIATTTPPFLDPVWSFRLGEIPGFPHEKWNSMLAARRRSTDRALPAMYPVARAGRIFFKSLGGIVALDARTGHKLWESAEYPGALSSYLAEALKLKSEKHASLTANLISWLQTAVFMDVTEFSIAAGEMNVISVNRVFPKSQISGSTVSTFVPSQAKQNQIAAFDIQTGRVKWRIFGGDNEDLKSAETVNSREFKNTFFLGAPTIHQGKVFVMGDSAGEVSLFVLRESDGSLLRRISLCLSQPAASEVAERRQDACPVTIHEGIALCPTQVGRLFAVAAHSGEILWTASYPRSTNPMPRSVYRTQRLLRRQVVAAPIVSGERVFFLPADGDRVLCLDLQTGRLIWKHLVDHEHVLAAVNSDRALVIGWDRKAHALHVDCLKIQDGIALKNNGTVHIDAQRSWLKPGGRGLLADHQYLLPIDGKRLVNIDLKTAKTTLVVKTALEYPPAVLPESRIPLPEQWRFTILKFKEDWTTPEFDDSGWRVTSPTVLLSHLGFTNFKGTVRYRVPFTATRADGPSRLVLSFGSLPQDSKIYINGRLVSSSKASAEQTDFDITGIYQPNRENLLALEVRTSSVHRLSVPFLHWQDRLNTRRELGNLIAHRGMVISAGPEGLDAYPQMKDVSESLQQRLAAKDPEAEDLLLMAKLHLNLGKDHEAEASIRKAQRLEARATIKEELRRALFQALLNQARKKPDSRVFQEALSLALTQREKYEVLLHLIDFHQAAGKGVQAVRIARELALSNPNHFVVLKDGRNIRADVWLQNKIGDIRSESQDREKIVEMFKADLAKAGNEASSLLQILRVYRELPECAPVYLNVAEQLMKEGSWQRAELLLLSQTDSRETKIASSARKQLIHLYHDLGLQEEMSYQVKVFKSLHGSDQLDAEIQGFLAAPMPENASPERRAVNAKIIFSSSYLRMASYHLPLSGTGTPFTRQTLVHMTSYSTFFMGKGWQWSLNFPYTARVGRSSPWRQRPFYGYSSQIGLKAVGHLIVGPFSQSLKAFSPLMRQVLWEYKNDWRSQARSNAQPSRFNVYADPSGSVRIQKLQSQSYQDYCYLVGASAHAVLLFDSGDLVALDPASGAVRWHLPVKGATQVLSLAGDHLLVNQGKELHAHRLRDGKLTKRSPAKPAEGLSYQGLSVTIDKAAGELRCISLIDRRVTWRKKLTGNTTFFRVKAAELGIIQEDGSLEIVSIYSGVTLFKSTFPVKDGLPFGQTLGWMTPSRLFLLLPSRRYKGIDSASQLKLLKRLPSQTGRLTAYGTLHCLENGGGLTWKREFNKHELFRSYGSGPGVFLATKRKQRKETKGKITRTVQDVDLEVIDIHSGKTIATESFNNPGHIYQIHVMDKKKIAMRSNRGTFQIEVEEE